MKKLLFIYNPNSGKGLIKNRLLDIIDIFVKAGYMPVVYPTQKAGDGYELLKSYSEPIDLVVCSGGDGTLDEVVTAMMEREEKVAVGYIPSGSTNDFAKSLRIPMDMRKAAHIAVEGDLFDCDIGDFNGDTFVYVAAFGMFTDVSYETPQSVKNILGHTAYVLEGMKRLYNIPSHNMKITCDGEVIEGEFLFGMVSNTRSLGGFKPINNEGVVFDDGLFEVTLIKRPENIIGLNEIVAALVIEQFDSRHMFTFQTHTLSLECEGDEEIAWTLDGEFGGNHNNVEIKNCNKAIQIMVDPKYKASLMQAEEVKSFNITEKIRAIADDIAQGFDSVIASRDVKKENEDDEER